MASEKLNMIFTIIIFALYQINTCCEAAMFTQPAAYHPDHPGKCFDKITRRPMLPDKEYKLKGICAVATCDLKSSTINIETCPYIDMPECEELPSDPRLSYPKCCPQFVCKDENGNETIMNLTT